MLGQDPSSTSRAVVPSENGSVLPRLDFVDGCVGLAGGYQEGSVGLGDVDVLLMIRAMR